MTSVSSLATDADLASSPSKNRSLKALYVIFFLSGVSALLFETLFFIHTGLTFGNSVWASSLVLASFMAGLTIGAGLASKFGDRLKNPVMLYAVVEGAIAVSGVGLVFFFPSITKTLIPVYNIVGDSPVTINAIRLILSFTLFLLPTICMGLTLPILVKALGRGEENFGKTLGRLYGLNTLGAFCGALLGEGLLIELVGVQGTGIIAGSLNLLVAVIAIAISGNIRPDQSSERESKSSRLSIITIISKAFPQVIGAFLAGASLLALEVLWFRFIQMMAAGTSFAFAAMLAVVLAGIGVGGLLSSRLLGKWPDAHKAVHLVALASGFFTLGTYASFMFVTKFISPDQFHIVSPIHFLILAAYLMFPVSALSGALFTFLGHRARGVIGGDAKTAGIITMANTTGAMVGALLAGFLLIPLAGVDAAILLLAFTYFAISVLLLDWNNLPPQSRKSYILYSALFFLSTFIYPANIMDAAADAASSLYRNASTKTVAMKEGLINTLQYLRYDFLEKPVAYRMLTNSYSMSATDASSLRYMKLYVYLPISIKPESENALLICFGTGSTAKALTEIDQLKSIDIVDLSKDILEMSAVIYGNGPDNPLNDPRVNAHVEDGRFFLTATNKRYDLITAEPPPPIIAGTVNLYSQEYFQLIHDRLNEGGIASYWLPLASFDDEQARSTLKAFCNVFSDCSLWEGGATDWMMVGTRGFLNGPDAKRFAALWQNQVTAHQLKKIGLEYPEQLGTLFILDNDQIRKLTDNDDPVTDNFPKRLTHNPWKERKHVVELLKLNDPESTRDSFTSSNLIMKWWPEQYRNATLTYFDYRTIVSTAVPSMHKQKFDLLTILPKLHLILTKTNLVIPAWWLLGSEVQKFEIIDEWREKGVKPNSEALFHLGVKALGERNYSLAYQRFTEAANKSNSPALVLLRILALCEDGKLEKAELLIAENEKLKENKAIKNYFEWIKTTFQKNAVSDV